MYHAKFYSTYTVHTHTARRGFAERREYCGHTDRRTQSKQRLDKAM